MKKLNLHSNGCDGRYKTFNIHFTSICDNKCAHCVDKVFKGFNIAKPDPDKIEDVLFLGGEPCLYLEELLQCIEKIKENTNLKVYLTTSVPYTCYKNKYLFYEIIELCDGVNFSLQHWDETIADEIRGCVSKYDRQSFYKEIPYKDKIRINLNLVKPYLYKKEDILKAIQHYDIGFNAIKFIELQHAPEQYCSMEKIFGFKLPSSYASGCQTDLTKEMIPELKDVKTNVILRRACFLTEPSIQPTFLDGVKAFIKFFKTPKLAFRVVYEDGRICNGWM